MERTLSGGRLEFVQGDIAIQDAPDAVVTAADLEAHLEDQEADR